MITEYRKYQCPRCGFETERSVQTIRELAQLNMYNIYCSKCVEIMEILPDIYYVQFDNDGEPDISILPNEKNLPDISDFINIL